MTWFATTPATPIPQVTSSGQIVGVGSCASALLPLFRAPLALPSLPSLPHSSQRRLDASCAPRDRAAPGRAPLTRSLPLLPLSRPLSSLPLSSPFTHPPDSPADISSVSTATGKAAAATPGVNNSNAQSGARSARWGNRGDWALAGGVALVGGLVGAVAVL